MPKAKKLHKSLSNLNARLAAKPKQSESTRKQPAPSQSSAKRNKKASARPIIPFAPTDRILLVGEGNFSFTRAILQHPTLEHIPPSNITATAYDSEEICNQKYPDAADIVAFLRSQGVKILFGVDATNLSRCSQLKNTRWDRIVWNFPHVGKGITDRDRNILANQELLLAFLKSAAPLLSLGQVPVAHRPRKKRKADSDEEDDMESENDDGSERSGTRGTILVSLRNVEPYTEWDLPKLAKNPPPSHAQNPKYQVLRSFAFIRKEWSGYEHRMTKGYVEGLGTGGDRVHQSGGGDERTWEFFLAD